MSRAADEERLKAKELFRRRVQDAFKRADEAFRGQYAEEITQLLGLSREELDQITPDATDVETYDKLISVVKEASRLNMEQAELAGRIKALGEIGVEIARKVPALAAIL